MADSKDISFSNLEDTISVQDYDFQTIDLSSSITMASPVFTISSAPTISAPTITIGGGGASGTYANTMWTTGTSGFNGTNAMDLNQSGKLSLQGTNADIDINGRSLMKTLDALQERLNMLTPNPEMEAEWDQLRELGERYRELEKLCKEKSTVWNKLKKI